jgi:hypothetical protein
MAIILNATPANGFSVSSDNSGNIQFQSNATNTLSIASSGLMTAAYNGVNAGLVPGQQMFVLNTPLVGQNATGNQSLFGLTNGVTLSSSTIYAFEMDAVLSKTAGTTSHTINIGFTGTATLNYIYWDARVNDWNAGYNTLGSSTNQQALAANTATPTATTGSLSSATTSWNGFIKGIVSVNTGGTFLPVYALSSAPGGAYTTNPGGYILIYPIGAAGANVSIGTWA